MIKDISSYFKNSLYSLVILSLSFACTNENIVSNNSISKKIKNNSLIVKQNESNEYNFYFDGDKTKTEKNNVKIKLSLGNYFNTKAQVRKRISDITNIKISLCDNLGNQIGNVFTILFNNKLDLNDITVNIKNIPAGIYYAKATARDSGFNLIAGDGDDNILNLNALGYDISSNSINVNAPNLNLSIIQDLKINLPLKNGVKDSTEFLFATTNQIIKPKLALDEKGNGIAYWKSNTKDITFARFKNFVSTGLESFYFSSEPNLTSIGDMTAYYSNGNGCLAFVKNKAGTTEIFNKKFTLNDDGYTDLGDFLVESTLGAVIYKDLNMQLDSKGNGTLVFSKLTGGKYNIYTMKYDSYTNSGSSAPFFEDTFSNKTKPRVTINHQGKGLIFWEDDATGHKEIVYAKVENYIDYANGTISAPNSQNISGSTIPISTTFTTNFPNFPSFIRVENHTTPVLPQVLSITNNNSLTIQPPPQNFTNKKYAPIISPNDANEDFGLNVKTNISGDGMIVWKQQVPPSFTAFVISGLKINNFTFNTSNIQNGPYHNALIELDTETLGLTINTDGKGYIVYSSGSTTGSRQLIRNTFTNYTLTNTPVVIKTPSNELFTPDVALNNSGSGIVIYPYNPSIINLYGQHIQEYVP